MQKAAFFERPSQTLTILWRSLSEDKVTAMLANNDSGLGTEILNPGRRTNKHRLWRRQCVGGLGKGQRRWRLCGVGLVDCLVVGVYLVLWDLGVVQRWVERRVALRWAGNRWRRGRGRVVWDLVGCDIRRGRGR